MAPVGGVDYPRSYAEFRSWFADDAACVDYLDWLRWPAGWSCPLCGCAVGWALSNGRRECAGCGRQTETKARVAIAAESPEPKGIGRIRLQHVADVSKASLVPFVQASVEPGSTVRTDGWQAYWTLPDHGYLHDRIVVSRGRDRAHVAMPNVHRVASLLKRWLLGTHQGAVQVSHLQAYLDEFAFRFNRRRSRA